MGEGLGRPWSPLDITQLEVVPLFSASFIAILLW